ncbi:MAG: Uricase (urate oxidase), partial [uncultured Nocardioidaceae bacterium]
AARAARVRPRGAAGAHRDGDLRSRPRARRVGTARPRGAQDDRLGVRRLLRGPLHDPAADLGPGHGHVGDGAVVAPDGRRPVGAGVRRRACGAVRGVRGVVQPGAAADAVRDGRRPARRGPERRGGPAVAAEQAPLRGRPQPVRAREPERGLLRRRPAVRAHRGDRPPRRRPRAGAGVRPRSGLV